MTHLQADTLYETKAERRKRMALIRQMREDRNGQTTPSATAGE